MKRLRCEVPHCKRTYRNDKGFDQWLCGDHWRLLPKDERRVYGRHMRQWRRFRDPGAGAAAHRLWARLVKMAIERAAGL